MRGYWRASLSAPYNYFASILLLAGYEVLVALFRASGVEVRNYIDYAFSYFLAQVPRGSWLVSVGIILVGFVYLYFLRRERKAPYGWVIFLMLIEGSLWGVVLYKFFPLFFQKVWGSQVFAPSERLTQIALSLGAGFYEELFFRLILVQVLIWLFSGFRPREAGLVLYLSVLLVSAALFSLAHFVSEPPSSYAFLYRFLFGLVMSGLYMLRGFAIVAWAHAIYDIAVFWNL